MIDPSALPTPITRRKPRISAVWLVPAIAILAAITILVRMYVLNGPKLEIAFENAEGLEAGKSEVRFKNVPVGRVTKLEVDDDLHHIIATVELDRGASRLAVADSAFWIERPRIGVGGVSGLGTLVSGPFIGIAAGVSKDKEHEFIGLEHPPGVLRDQKGRVFKIVSTDAGSLALRSPVYLHKVAVGYVSALEMRPDGKHVDIEVFIQAPYENTVTTSTVFWNAGGFDVQIDGNGLKLDTQSLATVVAGGLAYDEREGAAPGNPATSNAVFPLFLDRARAMLPPDGMQSHIVMRFKDSMRGVGVGAPIDFSGVVIGFVDSLEPGWDGTPYTDVRATLYPERLGSGYASLAAPEDLVRTLVGKGMRSQIRSGNLLTGQAYIALAIDGPVGPVPVASATIVVPTEAGGTDALLVKANTIADKISKVVDHVDRAIDDIVPDTKRTIGNLGDSLGAIKETLKPTLQQFERAAYSIRSLAEFLERHPEALVRGRK